MNEVFQGRFGAEPPVRTTIAAAGGIPGNSLVEIDVIAYIFFPSPFDFPPPLGFKISSPPEG